MTTERFPGQIYTDGRRYYEWLREGCATGMRGCPHAHPATVYQAREFKRDGWKRTHLSTICVDADTLDPDPILKGKSK